MILEDQHTHLINRTATIALQLVEDALRPVALKTPPHLPA
jgi:hypothetical protein